MGSDAIEEGWSRVDGREQELLDRVRDLSARQIADRIVATDLAAYRDSESRSFRSVSAGASQGSESARHAN